jgi:hypothetical protein
LEAGVEQQIRTHPGDHVERLTQSGNDRAGFHHALGDFGVGLLDVHH